MLTIKCHNSDRYTGIVQINIEKQADIADSYKRVTTISSDTYTLYEHSDRRLIYMYNLHT